MRYQSNRPKRQFLAGVVCKTCGQMDTTVQIQIFTPAFDEYIECTHCGHLEHRPTIDEASTMRQQDGYDDGDIAPVRFVVK